MLLHAASFVHRGHGVLVTGWQKGGKTETLLPFTAAGAHYVADEWTIVGGTGGGMYGLSAVARLWDWHLRQVPQYWERITPAQRARLRVWRGYRRLYRALPRHDHVQGLARAAAARDQHGRRRPVAGRRPDPARTAVRRVLDDLAAYELRHPYPVDLHVLYDAADPYC